MPKSFSKSLFQIQGQLKDLREGPQYCLFFPLSSVAITFFPGKPAGHFLKCTVRNPTGEAFSNTRIPGLKSFPCQTSAYCRTVRNAEPESHLGFEGSQNTSSTTFSYDNLWIQKASPGASAIVLVPPTWQQVREAAHGALQLSSGRWMPLHVVLIPVTQMPQPPHQPRR